MLFQTCKANDLIDQKKKNRKANDQFKYVELHNRSLFGLWNLYLQVLYTSLNLAFTVLLTGEAVQTNQETLCHGLWRCSICTFDNDESLSACDICGVLRNPLVNIHKNSETKTGIN